MTDNRYLKLADLKKIVDREVSKGNGDAIVIVQADADSISDIVITDYEGCGYELGGDVKVFSLVSEA